MTKSAGGVMAQGEKVVRTVLCAAGYGPPWIRELCEAFLADLSWPFEFIGAGGGVMGSSRTLPFALASRTEDCADHLFASRRGLSSLPPQPVNHLSQRHR
jgi:hypothetical protein